MSNEAKFKQHLVELQSQKATLREIFGSGEGDNEVFEDLFQVYLNSVKWLDSNGQGVYNEVKDQETIDRLLEELQGGSKLKNEFQLEFKRGRVSLKQFTKSMLKIFDEIETNLRNKSQKLSQQHSGGGRNGGASTPIFTGSGVMVGSNLYPNQTQQEPSRTPTLGLSSNQRGQNSHENSSVPIDAYFNPQDSQSYSQSIQQPKSRYQPVELRPEPMDRPAQVSTLTQKQSAFASLPQPTPAVSQPYPSNRMAQGQGGYTASLAMPSPNMSQTPIATTPLASQLHQSNHSSKSIRDLVVDAEQDIFKRMRDTQDRLDSVRKELFHVEHLESQLREQLRRVKEDNVKQELLNKRNEMVSSDLRPEKELLQQQVEELIDANERLEAQLEQKLRSQQEGTHKQLKALQAEKVEVSQITNALEEENRRVLEQIETLKSYIKMDTLGQGHSIFTPLFYAQPEDARHDEKSLELLRLREGINSTSLGHAPHLGNTERSHQTSVTGPLADMYGYNKHKRPSDDLSHNSFTHILEGRPSAPVTSLQGKNFSSRFLRS